MWEWRGMGMGVGGRTAWMHSQQLTISRAACSKGGFSSCCSCCIGIMYKQHYIA